MATVRDCNRHGCVIKGKRHSYATLSREWRCNDCGGRLVRKMDASKDWIECGRCGSRDIVRERDMQRQHHDAVEVLDGLPEEYREMLGHSRTPSLSLEEYNRLMHGETIDI